MLAIAMREKRAFAVQELTTAATKPELFRPAPPPDLRVLLLAYELS